MNKDIEDFLYRKVLPYREKREKGEEDKKTYGDVFDRRTLLAFYKILKRGVKIVEFPISTGKEATVFRGIRDDKFVALKVYCITRLNYKSLSRFIDGDDRFTKVHKTKDNIVFIWARKEFKNLQTMHEFGVRVPRPIDMWKNIIVMEYIGDEIRPAPLMKDVIENLKKDFVFEIIEEMKKIIKAGLIHGDISEYNVLVWNNAPYIIDVGQAVPRNHPLASMLLSRDLKNIIRIGKKFGVNFDFKELLREMEVI